MINWTLYKREMKGSIKMLLVFSAIITLYVSVIISMYDPELAVLLDGFVEMMPELMAAVGMSAGASNLLGFMVSYLYGFILLIFPMLFCILRGNGLISKYADRGSIVSLVAAPVKRSVIAFTQMAVLVSGVFLLVLYSTVLELGCAHYFFPGELDTMKLLTLNAGLLCLHLFIGGICFLASCACSDTKYSIGFGAGIPAVMYVLQMLANVGGNAEKAKYFTFFTLFHPEGIVAGESAAMTGVILLFTGGIVLFTLGITVFSKRDLHI
ncbi:MAG: ABC transporter permease [Lachnospiraceae bacterium]